MTNKGTQGNRRSEQLQEPVGERKKARLTELGCISREGMELLGRVASSGVDTSFALVAPELLVVAGHSADRELRLRCSCWLTKVLERPPAVVVDDVLGLASKLGRVAAEGSDEIWLRLSPERNVLAATTSGEVMVASSRPASAADLSIAMPPTGAAYDERLRGVLNVEASWLTGAIPRLAEADSAIVRLSKTGLRPLPILGEDVRPESCYRGTPQHFNGDFAMRWKADHLARAFGMFSLKRVTLFFDHPSGWEMAKFTLVERTLGWSLTAELVYSFSLEDLVEAVRTGNRGRLPAFILAAPN